MTRSRRELLRSGGRRTQSELSQRGNELFFFFTSRPLSFLAGKMCRDFWLVKELLSVGALGCVSVRNLWISKSSNKEFFNS